ncbi:hypothetical protein pEaSNUABM5_00262 [Erwinia phage pEa_SNUABM_5]|uniref:Uncharacterized protein n=1 Tax=Erwinia phage pEa_SNUABM_5 TaxID=2797313 RepID=A0A7T8EQ83_9CAUD|nr:hypothetical protein MPK73_gp262 [Erwinia phage pEa_SNUABM_5]QQO90404.1 hypothetical protein pEaSNUABM5_00262 [Erwinia phage pEa_SNUABM_5]
MTKKLTKQDVRPIIVAYLDKIEQAPVEISDRQRKSTLYHHVVDLRNSMLADWYSPGQALRYLKQMQRKNQDLVKI